MQTFYKMLDSEKNNRIAKNTIYLYLRLLVSLILNLYISRLLLSALGVEDFGTYNIVGGIVTLMLFINSTMHNASLRFINVSIGKGCKEDIKKTISSSIQIHLLLSLIYIFIGETIGLWYVIFELNIPDGSYETVQILYQLTLLTSVISIIQVPLTSTVISYERMDIYAYVEIFHVILKCGIIFIVPLFTNRLLSYGVFLLFVAIVIFVVYLFCCLKYFENFCLYRLFDLKKLKEMFSFAIFNLIGDGTFAVRQQGTNLLINKYFGVGLNAASGVATQVASLISTFVSNTQSAFKPQIIKEYSAGNLIRMKDLMKKEAETMFILLSIMFNVVYINIDYIMQIWLKTVPPKASDFCRVILICNTIVVFLQILSTAIHASGKVKVFNIVVGSLNIACLFLVFAFFVIGFDSVLAYYSYLIIIIFKILCVASILVKNIPEITLRDLINMIWKPFLLLAVSYCVTYFSILQIEQPIYSLIVSTIANTIIVAVLSIMFYPYIYIIVIRTVKRNKL